MIKLFFSYSHKDEHLRNELEKHLSILRRKGIIETWHDRRIEPGKGFGDEINNNLVGSQIILLLISSDFLASDYCYEKELTKALELHQQKKAIVIPVILRPCDWKDSSFGNLLATPTDGKPVIKFTTLDDGFLEVTNEIKRAAAKIKTSPIVASSSAPQIVKSSTSRSSNLRITKLFSDHERHMFINEAFEYIRNYFDGSLNDLKNRNNWIEYQIKKSDAESFYVKIFSYGKLGAECMIFMGRGMLRGGESISYSNHISMSKNSMNESLSVIDDGYELFLKPLGFAQLGTGANNLTFEGAAEMYWQMLIRNLQSSTF